MENVTAFQNIFSKVDACCFQGQGSGFRSVTFAVLKFNITENLTEKLPANNSSILIISLT